MSTFPSSNDTCLGNFSWGNATTAVVVLSRRRRFRFLREGLFFSGEGPGLFCGPGCSAAPGCVGPWVSVWVPLRRCAEGLCYGVLRSSSDFALATKVLGEALQVYTFLNWMSKGYFCLVSDLNWVSCKWRGEGSGG